MRDSVEEEEVQDDQKYLLQCCIKAAANGAGTAAAAAAGGPVVSAVPYAAPAPAPASPNSKKTKLDAHEFFANAFKHKKPLVGVKLSPYPFEMKGTAMSPEGFAAEITWPSLQGCTTKVCACARIIVCIC